MSIIIIISFEKNINQKLQLSFLNKSTIRIIIKKKTFERSIFLLSLIEIF